MSIFIFGDYSGISPYEKIRIEAQNLEHAIKLFKVSELFPEKYVDKIYRKKNADGIYISDYDCILERTIYEFKIPNPKIKIYEEDGNLLGQVFLNDCINVDFREILPQNNLLEAPCYKTEETTLPIIGNSKAITQCSKVMLREQHNAILMKKAELEAVLSQYKQSLDAIKKELSQKMKIVYIIETYMGINEQVIQIREGLSTESNTPLTLYQQLLYMDEEIGIWGNGGLDFTNIDIFDKWIAENFKRYLYKPLSICAFKIRRKDKNYGDFFSNVFLNENNKKTYFVIRNGENLYRIFSDVTIGERLFPAQDEYQKLFEEHRKFNEDTATEKVHKKHEQYLYGLIAIQGLIERTNILGTELKKYVNLTRVEQSPKEWIEFIRDDESQFWITDGKLSWRDFCKKNRSKITEGTRIVMSTSHVFDIISRDHKDNWRCFPFRPSRTPKRGEIFIVKEIFKNEKLKIYYMPGDPELWDTHIHAFRERKKRVPWIFYLDEVLNYDEITIEDCEYFEKNRLERKDYLDILPTLHWIKQIKKEEQDVETNLVRYLAGQLNWAENQYEEIRGAIKHWKLKNKWKRAVTSDESKAVRMILDHLKRKYYGK